MLEKLRDILGEYVKCERNEITADSELRGDLGLSSLDLVSVAVAVEEKLGVEIPDRQVNMLRTVGDVIKFLENA